MFKKNNKTYLKILLFIFIPFIFITNAAFGQIVNPSFSSRDLTSCDILKIERNSTNTIIYFKFTAPQEYKSGGWVCAGGNFFIRDISTKEKYKLVKANNIPICPTQHKFKTVGQILNFSLVFEALPTTTSKIDIIEDEISGGFNFFDVILSNTEDQVVDFKTLKSEGQMRETDSPVSNTIFTLPIGTQVKVLGARSGYYRVEHNGKTGYINEIFFQYSGLNVNNSSQSQNKSSTQNNLDCDKITQTPQSSKPDFKTMLAGVKHAVIVNKAKINGHVPAFNALVDYLQKMGFETVGYLDDNYVQPSNLCEELLVELSFGYDLQKFYNIKMTFANLATGYSWELSTEKIARAGLYSDPKYNFGQALRDMYGFTKGNYNKSSTMHLMQRLTCWTEAKTKSYIKSNGGDDFEGIYENTGSSDKMAKYKVSVRKINGIYHLIYLSGAQNLENWKEGEVKATLEPTATPSFYKAKWVMADKSENSNYYVSFERGILNVVSDDKDKDMYIKMFPSSSDNVTSQISKSASSGTGYAISSDGYIVTNHHVTNGAHSIKIRGINGDFSKTYSAKFIIEDRNNDLSIIKIDDPTFINLGSIPYLITNRGADVGSSIFVLGYPLRATMGDEVKLTNGIISSKSGFQGDVTSYQITAPIQPGNSGGPLFDSKGNIIGIINAKHTGAENASYAIKSSYLMNLIDLMPSHPKLQSINIVANKPLTEQVKILKKFTYIIEINQ